jgi:hypothetical protein
MDEPTLSFDIRKARFVQTDVNMGHVRPNEQRLSDAEATLDEGTAVHGVR